MKTKRFDSVKLMRQLRDQLSEEMAGMTPDERTRFIQERAAASGLFDIGALKECGELREAVDDAPRPD